MKLFRREVAAAHPADTWPGVNANLTIAKAEAWNLPTRVEDVSDSMIAIAAPRLPAGLLEIPEDGEPFDVFWVGERGVLALPTVFRDRGIDNVRLWWLEVTGPVELRQRRDFVRARAATGWPVRVRLEWVLPEHGTAEGELLDLSEGGLRARMHVPSVPVQASVAILLTVAEGTDELHGPTSGVDVTEFDFLGTVVRAVRTVGTGEITGTTDVGVQFHETGRQSDDLRALVFAWQRLERR